MFENLMEPVGNGLGLEVALVGKAIFRFKISGREKGFYLTVGQKFMSRHVGLFGGC